MTRPRGKQKGGMMARRRNKIEILEDGFADLTLDEQRQLMPVLRGMLTQSERHGAALADLEPKTKRPADRVADLFEAGRELANGHAVEIERNASAMTEGKGD